MDISSSFNSRQQAVQLADFAAERHGETVARHGARIEGSQDQDAAVVEARPVDDQAHVGASVVRATDEVLGSVVDTHA